MRTFTRVEGRMYPAGEISRLESQRAPEWFGAHSRRGMRAIVCMYVWAPMSFSKNEYHLGWVVLVGSLPVK